MTTPGTDSGSGAAGDHPHRTWPWAAVAILAAALVIVPPVVYQTYHAALTVSFVVLPFALVTLRTACARLATCLEPRRCAAWAVGLAMGVVLSASLVMHLPGYGPEPIRSLIDPHTVFGRGPGASVRVVRSLIAHYLTADEGSVLAQFYTFCAIPQRRLMYLTLWDRGEFLAGRLKPKFVLLDLNADDPWVPRGDLRAIVDVLRRGDAYRPLYDVDGVLLYPAPRWRRMVGGGSLVSSPSDP